MDELDASHPSSHPVNSREWLDAVLRSCCKVSKLWPYQLDLGMEINWGTDVYCTIATGMGKTRGPPPRACDLADSLVSNAGELESFGFFFNFLAFPMFVIGDAIFSKVRDSEHDAGDAMPDDRPCNKKPTRPGQAEEVEMEQAPAPVPAAHERKIGDTYDPDLLPDHRGSYFDHRVSKLVQRDHRDEDEKLIVPHELYSQLTEGTLFCARIRFETFIFKGDRLSHLCGAPSGPRQGLGERLESTSPFAPRCVRSFHSEEAH
ncbi:hypothetical protein B0H10DRAFT_2311697 [Mycena sp. CBHHK59/15]|nr:hypothetical protein B0H10DRAFT_2311697 [Mycena sp. CBHHK59/15]